MKRTLLIFIAALACSLTPAQKEEQPQWGIKFSGFVNTDYYWDSRQTVSAREGHFLLWPAMESLDPNDRDINAVANFNMLAIRSRLRGTISGPDVLGAKTSAVIEGSFFGHSDRDLNEFRLRHAFAKMTWARTELIMGQTWHPMFIPACFPDVLNFNTGAPFQPFARNPQIRLTHDLGILKVSATALGHADFATAAGIGGLRNSGLPEVHLQAWHNQPASDGGTGILIGGGAGYKQIVPEIVTINGYKTSEGTGSFSAEVYSKITLSAITFKAEAAWGQNNYDVLMLGSYAPTGLDAVTGENTWTPTSCYAVWTEIHSNHKTWQPGLFAGYTKNLGAAENIINNSVAGTRGNIDFIYRLSPRVYYSSGKMKFGLEVEYTVAAFGTINDRAEVEDATAVGNFRTMVGAFYFF